MSEFPVGDEIGPNLREGIEILYKRPGLIDKEIEKLGKRLVKCYAVLEENCRDLYVDLPENWREKSLKKLGFDSEGIEKILKTSYKP